MHSLPKRTVGSAVTASFLVIVLVPFLLGSGPVQFPIASNLPSRSLASTLLPPKGLPIAHQGVPSPQRSTSPMMQMPMVFPLFLQNQDFDSTLVLTSALVGSTYADVILKTTTGTEITRKRVEFSGHSQRIVDVQSLLMSAVSPATTGTITVTQQSPELDGTIAILGQLSLTYHASEQPNYIDEEIAMPSAQGSQTLRAVGDAGEASPLVAITNLSDGGQHVAIQCLTEKKENFSKSVDLLAGETLLTEACSGQTTHGATIESFPLADPAGPHGPVGISLTTDGMPGTLAAFGLLRHKKGNNESFSAVAFTDPKTLNSPTTIFAGVPVGPAALLQPGKYVPELSLANFSAKDLDVHVQYAETSGAVPTTKEIAALTVPSGTSKSITFDNLQGDAQLQNSFLVASNGSPGDLMAKLVSRSDSSPASVELLGKDAQDSNNGGSNPWSIERGTESTLLFFNHDKAAQIFNVLIASADGSQWDKDFKLAPMETMAISIGDIVQKQMKDEKGKTLPKTTVSGQISWWTVGTASGPGTGRLAQSNRASRMARSFACGCPYTLCGAIFTQDVSSMVVGDTAAPLDELTPQICMYRVNSHCSGIPGSYFSSQALTYSWYSSNTAVLQVSGYSNISYVDGYGAGGGTATMTGEVSATYFGPPETCTFYGSAQTTVQAPTYFFTPSATQTGTPAACTQANGAGYFLDVSYYVADKNSARISKSGMAPGEHVSNGTGWNDAFATPPTTKSDGSFDDTPVGGCFSPAPNPPTHHCETGPSQSFRLTNNGTIFSIATNTTRKECTDGIQLVIQGNPSAQNKTYTFGNTQ